MKLFPRTFSSPVSSLASLRLVSGLLLAGAFGGHAAAQSGSYNFNSGQTDFNNTFTSNGGGGNGIATISATTGIGASGALSTDGVTNHSIVFNQSLANSTGAVITTSFYFQTRSTLSTGDLVGLSLLNSTTALGDAATGVITYKINGSNSSGLLASTWYQLSATITNTGTVFHTTLSLQNYGSNGTTLTGSPIGLAASDAIGGTLLTTSSIYVGLYGGQLSYQTPAIDNFSVSAIPEPSTYAAIAGAAMLGLAVWRRRRQAGPPLAPTP